MDSTQIKLLTRLRDEAGILFPLRPYMTINSMSISDTTVKMNLTVHRYTETVSRVTLTARGRRLLVWTKLPTGKWEVDEFTAWDDDFEPVQIHQVGRIETPAEYHARRAWEANTYRVGTAKSPMDNAARSADPTYSPMYDYWMKG